MSATRREETVEELAEAAREHARERTEGLPQYDGRFDEMIPVRVTRDVGTKMGRAFREGDVTIADPQSEIRPHGSSETMLLWSVRNGVLTTVYTHQVEVL